MLTYNMIIKILKENVKSSLHEYEWVSQNKEAKKDCCLLAELNGKYKALKAVLDWIEELNGADRTVRNG